MGEVSASKISKISSSGVVPGPNFPDLVHPESSADIPRFMSEPLPANLLSVTESGQQKGAGR
jgi:hypothetical protein